MAWDNDIPIEEQKLTERILMITHSIQLLKLGNHFIHREGIKVLRQHIKELKEKPKYEPTKMKKE